MKRLTKISRNNAKNILICLSALVSLFVAPAHPARSQTPPVESFDVKQYLKEKYQIDPNQVYSNLSMTKDGPVGKLRIDANIVLENTELPEDEVERAKAIAEAFLKEEASLFGIFNIAELQDVSTQSGQGQYGNYININYRRFIESLELSEMSIHLRIGPGDKITHVNAELVPVSQILYAAVASDTLTEEDVRKIIEEDLKDDAQSKEIDPIAKSKIEQRADQEIIMQKFLISSDPYVVYYAEAVWAYTIDALQGKILSKTPTWIVN